jgi:aminopeptidase N
MGSSIYYYGALVWEQLRQKMGDEALLAGLTDLFRRYRLKPVGYPELLDCLQSRSDVSVEEYLSQWIGHNAVIDLTVGDVTVSGQEGAYRTQVEVVVDSDRDYELFTSVGFRTSSEGPMETVDTHIDRRGSSRVTLESSARPVFIQVDPAFRVPQVNLDNNTWSRPANEAQPEGPPS